MTRGRRKDMTIPPSRALLQQRDYRARKARYVADLEERCKQMEEENARLREQIDALSAQLRAAGQSAARRTSPSPEMTAATNDLVHNLSAAAHSIAHFQQVAFGPPPGSEPSSASSLRLPPIQNHTPTSLATPSFTPSPLPQSHRLPPSPRQRIELPPLHAIHRDLFRGPGEPSSYSQQQARMPGPSQAGPSNCGYSESECCGGYLDCTGLVEDEDDVRDVDDDATSPESANTAQRMSDVRSTRSSSGPEDAGPSSGSRLPQPQ